MGKMWMAALLPIGALVGGQAMASGQDAAAKAFVQHPTHCATLLGGEGQKGESATGDYSRSLAAAIGSAKGQEAAKLKDLKAQCGGKREATRAPQG